MSDIRNVVFFRFRDVTKQNDRNSEGTLDREPLGEIVVHYDSIYKFILGDVYVVLNPYEPTFVHIEDFWSVFLLEVISHRYKVCTISYCCYLMVACPKCCRQH